MKGPDFFGHFQVVCLKTISNSNPNKLRSVVQKILLQVNVKLGGELWALRSSFKNVMVVGVDVYHDKLKKNGSVASVVMSLNDNMSHYYSQAVVHREVSFVANCDFRYGIFRHLAV